MLGRVGESRARVDERAAPSPHLSPSSHVLDAIRGIAALLVVAGHCRQLLSDAGGLSPFGSSGLERILLAPTGFAQEAVAVFFVLSGYLVGGQVVRQCREDRFTWGVYLAKRLSRLWTVLLPGLLVTWLAITLAGSLIPASLGSLWGADRDSPLTAACNAAFLQEARCDTYGVNESLWSLSYEFWFYVVFAAACAALAASRRRRLGAAALNVVVLIAAIGLFGPHLLVLIPAWLLGVVVALVPVVRARAVFRSVLGWLAAAIAVLGGTMLASTLMDLDRPALTAMVSVPAALVVLLGSLVQSTPRWLTRFLDATSALGRISFSMYIFHVPLVAVAATAMARHDLVGWLGLPASTYLLMVVITPLTAGLWWLTERHTPVVRRLALRLVDRPPREPGRPRIEFHRPGPAA